MEKYLDDKTTHVISNKALAGATKGLNGENITFLHLGLIAALDDRHALTAVDAVREDVVSVQIPDTLHRKGGAADLDLVALHHLLDGATNVTHAHINARFLLLVRYWIVYGRSLLGTYANSSVGGILDGVHQIIVDGIKRHGEGAVRDAAVDMHADIHLHDILLV